MPKSYCITMELTQRSAWPVTADTDDAAETAAEARYGEIVKDGTPFEPADMETIFALDAAGGRNVIPWTSPVSVDYPGTPEKPVPSRDDPYGPDGAYTLTVERTVLIAEWFDARNDAEAETMARKIMDEYNADPRKFDAGYADCDYALTSPEGTDVVPWR